MNDFAKYLSKFFTSYLRQQRGCTENTILTYRDSFKKFLKFVEKKGINIKKFDIQDLKKDIVLEFLDEIESDSSIATRNIRRASIVSFCNFLIFEEPELLDNINGILSIPIKKGTHKIVDYLLEDDMKLLLRQPNINVFKERNDMIILSVLYDTATRISEFLNIKLKDISFTKPYSIRVLGKGNKYRDIPIMQNTIDLLKRYVEDNSIISPDQYLFCNSRGEQYTRKGISHKIDKYSTKAKKFSSTFPEKVHPHMFRHTKSVVMLNSGIDLLVISQFLGHSLLETTQIYAKITDENKRKILENAYFENEPQSLPDWLTNNDIMEFLENL